MLRTVKVLSFLPSIKKYKDSAWLLMKPSPPNFVRPLLFLAYFQILQKYAIVRALSVRLSVPLLLFRGLTNFARLWLNRKLITPGYEPREEIFFGPVLVLIVEVCSPNSIQFHIKIRFY
jgi:hypothetical protein